MVRFTENQRLVLSAFGHLAVEDTFLTILPLTHFFGFKIESHNPASPLFPYPPLSCLVQ